MDKIIITIIGIIIFLGILDTLFNMFENKKIPKKNCLNIYHLRKFRKIYSIGYKCNAVFACNNNRKIAQDYHKLTDIIYEYLNIYISENSAFNYQRKLNNRIARKKYHEAKMIINKYKK